MKYRIRPAYDTDRWSLERWVEPRHGWLFTQPGYWTDACGHYGTKEQMRALAEHLSQPPEEYP